MGKFKDLTGQMFGALKVLGRAANRPGKSDAFFLCECKCGKRLEIRSGSLTASGRPVRSCGCHYRDGRKKHPLYRRWTEMIQRCENPNSTAYKNYGGRGIKVCPAWRKSFRTFLADMGECPPGMTLDRLDSSGNYEPTNCRWASWQEQQRNRRGNRRVLFRGEQRLYIDIAKMIGADPRTISKWGCRGLDVAERAERYAAERRETEA